MIARVAVVGAGPSGFYAADQLLREGIAVDRFDAPGALRAARREVLPAAP